MVTHITGQKSNLRAVKFNKNRELDIEKCNIQADRHGIQSECPGQKENA